MSYTIDNNDLAGFSAFPVQGKEHAVLEGVLSFPRRKGESEYNWGDSVEAFVSDGEIEFEARKLTLNMLLKTEGTFDDYRTKLETLKEACSACKTLGTPYDTFTVTLGDGVTIKEYPRYRAALFAASFTQETFQCPDLVTTPTGQVGEYRITDDDNRTFSLLRDFGIYVSGRRDNHNIGKRSGQKEFLPREKSDIVLSCNAVAENFETLYAAMRQFHAFCASPGEKQLVFPGGETYPFYIRDGFTVTQETNNAVKFDFKIRQL